MARKRWVEKKDVAGWWFVRLHGWLQATFRSGADARAYCAKKNAEEEKRGK